MDTKRAWRVARTPAFVAPVSLEYLFSSFELSSCCESLSLRCMDSSRVPRSAFLCHLTISLCSRGTVVSRLSKKVASALLLGMGLKSSNRRVARASLKRPALSLYLMSEKIMYEFKYPRTSKSVVDLGVSRQPYIESEASNESFFTGPLLFPSILLPSDLGVGFVTFFLSAIQVARSVDELPTSGIEGCSVATFCQKFPAKGSGKDKVSNLGLRTYTTLQRHGPRDHNSQILNLTSRQAGGSSDLEIGHPSYPARSVLSLFRQKESYFPAGKYTSKRGEQNKGNATRTLKPVPDNPEGKGRQNDNHRRDTKKAALPRNNRRIEKAARNTDTTKEREAEKGCIPTTINQAKRKQLFEQTQEDEVVG
ncbi:hypothetical protein Bca101_020274 [Brassica carinata]